MNDFSRYWKALNYALIKYGDLKRKQTDICYIVHPLRMTLILRAAGFSEFKDEDLMIAALFHDLLENTNTTFEEIEKEFGSKVASIVRELTIPDKEKKEWYLKNLENSSYETMTIKLADRIDNLIDMSSSLWSIEKRNAYAIQAKIILDSCKNGHPELANRLREEIDNNLKKL